MKYLLIINPYTWEVTVEKITPEMIGTSISGVICHVIVAANSEEALKIGQDIKRDYQLNPRKGRDYFIVTKEDTV
jgi:hypothetical protein